MSLRPSKPASARAGGGAAAFRAHLAQCTAAAHRWNLQNSSCGARKPAPAPDHTPVRTDASYADFEEAYSLGKAPRWTWPNLVAEKNIRGRSDRDGTSNVPNEPGALACRICTDELDEKTSNQGAFGGEELEILQELTEEARESNPGAPVVCGHAFHKNCLARWIREGKNTCPVCRSPIAGEVIARLVPGGVPVIVDDDEDDEDDEEDDEDDEDDEEDDAEDIYNDSRDDSREKAENIVDEIEEIFEDFDGDVDDYTPQELENLQLDMIQQIQTEIEKVLQDARDSAQTEFLLFVGTEQFRGSGQTMAETARSLKLYSVEEWFRQRTRQVELANQEQEEASNDNSSDEFVD